MKKLRYMIEYLLVCPLLALADMLSPRASFRLGRQFGELWFRTDRRRREIAVDNILQSRICSDRKEAEEIARRSFQHFALLIVEALKSVWVPAGQAAKYTTEMHMSPELQKLIEDPKQGIILASGHLGNWELAAQALSRIKPVAGVARRMNNPYVDRLMNKRKPSGNFYVLPKYDRGNKTRFLEVLKNGHILALMIDQHASWSGIMVDFFGRPAASYGTAALLHLVTGTPLCFGYCLRTGDTRYELHAIGPFKHKATGNKEADIKAILLELNRELEKAIRSAPDQYLWAHRRWK